MVDLKVNSIFPFEGKLYKVIKTTRECQNCAAYCDPSLCEKFGRLVECTKGNRKDGNSVSFMELSPNRDTIGIGRSRTINDMKIRPIENAEFDKCIDCIFHGTCVRNNSDTTFAFVVQNYFGECNHFSRRDDKSVIFKLSGTDTFNSISDKLNADEVKNEVESFTNAHYDIKVKCNSLQLNLPTGRIIDKDKSDLSKGIIYFKDKQYLSYNNLIYILGANAIKYYGNDEVINNTIKLINIIKYYNLSFADKEIKKCIIKKGKNLYITDFSNVPSNSPFVINTREGAAEILDNPAFRDIIDKVSQYNLINNEKNDKTKK